jgi:uncharacterized protein
MMKINVLNVKKEIGSSEPFHFIVSADALGLTDQLDWLDGQLAVNGQVVNNGQTLEVQGVIQGWARYSCSRCLDEFVAKIEVPFTENFSETEENLTAEVNDIQLFQGDEIDLTEIVREDIILAEPIQPLCADDCRGLCTLCGVNLNKQSCTCESTRVDPRLEKLRLLLDKK